MKRNFKGVWIPQEIWLDKNLTWMEKLFLTEINSLDNENGCYASNKYFSLFFCLSKGRCTQIIKSLEEKKYLSIRYAKKGKQITKRIVRILNRGVNYSKLPSKKTKQGCLDNDEENNTLFNNTLYLDTFESFRNVYPGTKRGLNTEFKNFVKHKDWKKVLNSLMPSIQQEIEARANQESLGQFFPKPKHLKTWINERCWESEFEIQKTIPNRIPAYKPSIKVK